jgi:class 3 adenylate cyclase
VKPDGLKHRLRRAVERGDPRFVLAVGVLVSLAVALAFAARERITPTSRLELLALDLAFRWRPPIRESDRIAQIDMDDATFRRLRWPVPRESYAQAVHVLDRLGAKQIVFDVQFKALIPRPGDYDPETGEFILGAADRALRFAFERSGRVTLAYHADLEDPLPPEVRAAGERLQAAFLASPSAGAGEAARAAGLEPALLEPCLELAREIFFTRAVAGLLDADPTQSFGTLRRRVLPGVDARAGSADLHLLQYAYWSWRSLRAMEAKAVPVRVEGRPARPQRISAALPIHFPFLEAARGVGGVNAVADADGVLRRPWAAIFGGERAHAYLGLAAAARQLGEGGRPAAVTLHGDRIEIGDGSVPIDREGRFLVNFAGNRTRNRGGEPPFLHASFSSLLACYQARYEILDGNARRTILQVPEEDRTAEHAEYLKLSERLRAVLEGHGGLTPEESRKAEARLDELRGKLAADLAADVAAIDAKLPGLEGKERLKETLLRERSARAVQLQGLREGGELEAELRARIEGRLCIIGSASTASGDLHATPLGPATPGMDVLANAANMGLTGQSIRRSSARADFFGLALLGSLMSWIVSRKGTVASAAALGGLGAASAAVFAVAFTGFGVWVPGGGPAAVLLASFGSATAFKELVTQRSKRKLQRELEKNTSADLVKILLEHPEFLSEPRKMDGTFLFSDVKSFTSISEKFTPEVLVPFINRYLDRMTQALKAHQAYLDKYIGDGIMALFGIPVASEDHARNACLAALDCQAALRFLNREFEREGLPLLRSRIGIHSGGVIAGYVGAADRSDYTVLGDSVNLASRLEGANKEYGSEIMISAATAELTGSLFVLRELDVIRVVGKRLPVRIYELVGRSGEVPPFDAGFLPIYHAALEAMRARRWDVAIEGFEKAAALKPGDIPCALHAGRCRAWKAAPPPPDWDGVADLSTK